MLKNFLMSWKSPAHLLILDGFERALRAYSGMNAAYQEDAGDDTEEEYDTTIISPHAEYFLKGISTLS